MASAAFVAKTPATVWKPLGRVELKGLGNQAIFQMGKKTVSITEILSITKEEYEQLKQAEIDLEDQQIEKQQLERKNNNLAQQLKDLDQSPDPEDLVEPGNEEKTFKRELEQEIKLLCTLIENANSPSEYARFLFLYMRGESDKEDVFEGRTFTATREGGYLVEDNGYYSLDAEHRLNKRCLKILENISDSLEWGVQYQPEDEIFEWNLEDSNFWKEYIDYNVTSF